MRGRGQKGEREEMGNKGGSTEREGREREGKGIEERDGKGILPSQSFIKVSAYVV